MMPVICLISAQPPWFGYHGTTIHPSVLRNFHRTGVSPTTLTRPRSPKTDPSESQISQIFSSVCHLSSRPWSIRDSSHSTELLDAREARHGPQPTSLGTRREHASMRWSVLAAFFLERLVEPTQVYCTRSSGTTEHRSFPAPFRIHPKCADSKVQNGDSLREMRDVPPGGDRLIAGSHWDGIVDKG
ncbi:hypothetical protein BJV77DRAFT_121073 [Russula vinacea]|nr:hypothetical protein BJV77DRAFT_121073 [Russula vinacea]